MSTLPAALVLLGAALTSCAPGTPDEDSWRNDALRAVQDTSAQVATAKLALEQRSGITGPYLRTVVVDAEGASGSASQRLSSVQPPEAYESLHDETTGLLDDASTLVGDVRIAVVAGHADEYAGLVRELGGLERELADLESRISALPDDRSRP